MTNRKKLLDDVKTYIYYIYKLYYENTETNTSYIYIGSTNNMKERYANHISNANNPKCKEYNTTKYKIMRELDPNNFKMVIIYTTTEPITKTEAHKLEEQYRINLNANLNDFRCYRTKEQQAEQLKNYYKTHTQQTLEKQKQYYEENRELIKQKQKLFRQANKEKRAIQQRAYYLRKKAEQLNKSQTPT